MFNFSIKELLMYFRKKKKSIRHHVTSTIGFRRFEYAPGNKVCPLCDRKRGEGKTTRKKGGRSGQITDKLIEIKDKMVELKPGREGYSNKVLFKQPVSAHKNALRVLFP